MTSETSEKPKELVVESPPHMTGTMSKTRLMTYTFSALLIITIITAILWWPEVNPAESQIKAVGMTNVWPMSLGTLLLINALIAVGVAVGLDALIHKAAHDSELNIGSAAVFGLIVTLSYSLGVPSMVSGAGDIMPSSIMTAPLAFVYVAIITIIGLVVFKKLQGLAGRKFVNPAATAKLLVLLPTITSLLIVNAHFAGFTATNGGLSVPILAGPIGTTVFGHNGVASFTYYLQACYTNAATALTTTNLPSADYLMIILKFHGWPGGASSVAVIIVGIALMILARNYIKWKITLTYLVSVIVMALVFTGIYGGDAWTRILFEVFIGSSIFLAFFMATDPATTPFTSSGQVIFGVGLGILTVLIQTYMNFFGGSILALVIMNLTVPLLDRVGVHKPFGR